MTDGPLSWSCADLAPAHPPQWLRYAPRDGVAHPFDFIEQALGLDYGIRPADQFCAVQFFQPASQFRDLSWIDRVLLLILLRCHSGSL
jgi:hypothetical protein